MTFRRALAALALGAMATTGVMTETASAAMVGGVEAFRVTPGRTVIVRAWGKQHYVYLRLRAPRITGHARLNVYEIRCRLLALRSKTSRLTPGYHFRYDAYNYFGGGLPGVVGMPWGADAPGNFLWECKVRVWNERGYSGPWSVPRQALVRYHP
jgi:hypothetical protein